MADMMIPLPLEGGQARVPHRWCRRCGESKPITDYYSYNGKRQLICKKCYIDARIEHRRENPEIDAQWRKDNAEKLRAQSRENYAKRRATFSGWVKINFDTRRQQLKGGDTEFTLTPDDIIEIYERQEGLCALTGRELQWGPDTNRGPDTLSMDRIDSLGGYTKENVRLVTMWVNVARQRMTDDELVERCREVIAMSEVAK